MQKLIQKVFDGVVARDPHQPEFQQAVEEVLKCLGPVVERHPDYIPAIAVIVEPE